LPPLPVQRQEAAPAPAAPAETVSESEEFAGHPGVITSPMVGVVYTSESPDAPPFVKVGDSVTEGQTLLLIEAMKVFNPIVAPRSGKVARILVVGGVPVEFGEPLIVIE
jgi:acetyl-CoA carboxylase biotin carboxyl carrier protein